MKCSLLRNCAQQLSTHRNGLLPCVHGDEPASLADMVAALMKQIHLLNLQTRQEQAANKKTPQDTPQHLAIVASRRHQLTVTLCSLGLWQLLLAVTAGLTVFGMLVLSTAPPLDTIAAQP